jgi:molybdate transport system substrate-binding protein
MAKPKWGSDWRIGLRVAIERRSQTIIGQGRAELMDAIGREHSITAAAKTAGMSYRRAWMLTQEMNKAAGTPLVEAAVGGVKGGGARLTKQGQFALEVYRQLYETLHTSAAGVLKQIIGHDETDSSCVHLAAAISLQEVMGQLLAAYALRRPTVRVRAVYGASNELADHLLAGAPGDIFISAEESELSRLQAAGKILPRSRRVVARNDLAVAGPPRKSTIKTLSDLLGKKVQQVALAEPACPLGRYSQAYLKSAGVYDTLLPKVVHVDNSRAVLAAVASGTADAAIAFSSDAIRSEHCRTYFRIPHSQAAATYVAGIVCSSKKTDEPRLLLDFIASTAAANYFRRCGLRAPQDDVRRNTK